MSSPDPCPNPQWTPCKIPKTMKKIKGMNSKGHLHSGLRPESLLLSGHFFFYKDNILYCPENAIQCTVQRSDSTMYCPDNAIDACLLKTKNEK